MAYKNNPKTGKTEWQPDAEDAGKSPPLPPAAPIKVVTASVPLPPAVADGFHGMYSSKPDHSIKPKVKESVAETVTVPVPENETAEQRAARERDAAIDRRIEETRREYEDAKAARDGKDPAHNAEMRATYKPKAGER